MIQKLLFVIFFLIQISYTQTVNVKDSEDHTLIQINDEEDTGGSITLPDASSVATPDDKLYNIAGELRWDGRLLDDCEITREEFNALMSDYDALELRVVELEGICTPTTEICDGLDNDCDGSIDETSLDKGDYCSLGVGICNSFGSRQCVGDGTTATRCVVYVGGSCYTDQPTVDCPNDEAQLIIDLAQTEICDGLDNDCDGSIDETSLDKGDYCSLGVGICNSFGSRQCVGDGTTATRCVVYVGGSCYTDQPTVDCPNDEAQLIIDLAQTEICDGLDNDCNGLIDDGTLWDDLGVPCIEGVGECRRGGVKICDSSEPSGPTVCSAEPGPPPEETEISCDYLDNNCDGFVDEPWKTGELYTATDACGNCFTDCSEIYNIPNAYGVCDASGTPTCVFICDPGFYDLNGNPLDGCESSYPDCNSLWYTVCENYQTSGPCEDAGFCSWGGGDCFTDWDQLDCAQFNDDEDGCLANPACGYSAGLCERDPDFACSFLSESECGVLCELCEWDGSQCSAVVPTEICDGIDNDCDGLIDEGCS